MDAIKFGKFLASIRNEKKLTQEELAEKLYIDKRKISRWECGMSIPDFETVIKLSEILDVTPYEFSICKRLEKEKLSKKVINRFKSIKDFKKYKLKKKILLILSIILGVFFILTTIYTFKYYGKVEIYEFVSLDDKYTLNGTYVNTNNYTKYNINYIVFNNKDEISIIENLGKCEFEVFDNNYRLLNIKRDNKTANNQKIEDLKVSYYDKMHIDKYINKQLLLKTTCIESNKKESQYFIKFKFVKKYDNRLF